MHQSTSNIMLVRPASFNYNMETAESNAFQNLVDLKPEDIKQRALAEFDDFIERLKLNGVNALVIEDTPLPPKPDAIFPNNWGSFHQDGTVILYPMAAPNRRLEKREEILKTIEEKFLIKNIIDLSEYEKEGRFLEGTGSIIFDHIHKMAYACLSPRTDQDIFIKTCEQINYKPVYFNATDKNGQAIYHTNVMMCISEKFAAICLESIVDEHERNKVIESLTQTGHQIIDITLDQVKHFAGNMISIKNNKHAELLILSQSACDILTKEQKDELEKYAKLLPMKINTIETIGGGSARCMISEIFLPKK